jgi:predicted trehalose synthase
LFVLEKLVYELAYELNSRPDWARIPLAGLAELEQSQPGAAEDSSRKGATTPRKDA